MLGPLFAAAAGEIAALRQRAVRMAIGLVIALAGAIIMLVALLQALFVLVALHWQQGPLIGHLTVAGVALVVLIIASSVAFAKVRRRNRVAVAVDNTTNQAFDAARAMGEQVRGVGARVANVVGGARQPIVSRKTIANATLAAVILGLFLGRRF